MAVSAGASSLELTAPPAAGGGGLPPRRRWRRCHEGKGADCFISSACNNCFVALIWGRAVQRDGTGVLLLSGGCWVNGHALLDRSLHRYGPKAVTGWIPRPGRGRPTKPWLVGPRRTVL
jgi:hypothetical protein